MILANPAIKFITFGCFRALKGRGRITRIAAMPTRTDISPLTNPSPNLAETFADGLAVRVPVEEAFHIYSKGVERIISVSEEEIADAIRLYYKTTHIVAEGAGAAALAGLMQEKEIMEGKSVGIILSGANIDTDMLHTILGGSVPKT